MAYASIDACIKPFDPQSWRLREGSAVLVQRSWSCKSDDAAINGTREASPPDGEPLSAAAVVLPLDMEVEQRAIEAHFRLSTRNLLTPVRGARNVNQSWRFFGSKSIQSFGPKRAPIIFYIYLLCSVPGPVSIEMF